MKLEIPVYACGVINRTGASTASEGARRTAEMLVVARVFASSLSDWADDIATEEPPPVSPVQAAQTRRGHQQRRLLNPVDFGIITIKEEEFTAVEKRFAPVKIVQGEKRKYLYSRVMTPEGKSRDVLIARCLEQGHSDAQQCTNDLIHDANPQWILLVGIAGGLPSEEYTLGDVLLASRIYDLAITAALEGGIVEQNPRGGGVHPDVSRLLQVIPSAACQQKLQGWNGADAITMTKPVLRVPRKLTDPAFYGDEEWRKKVQKGLKANFQAKKPIRPPLFRVAAVATANTLVKDSELAATWKETARSVTHIEMELGGVYKAAQSEDKPVLSIRGISDIVGLQRCSAWTEYACQAAAAFAHALIVSGLIETNTSSLKT